MEQALINLRDMLLRIEAANNLVLTRINAAALASDDPIRSAQVRVTLNLNQFHMQAAADIEQHLPAIAPNVVAPKQPPQ